MQLRLIHWVQAVRLFTPGIALAACVLASLASGAHAQTLDVVASVPDLASLARAVGGDHVSVQSLSLPSQDPHFVDAKPSLALALHRADLLLHVGLQLEQGWLPTLLTGARNARVLPGAPGNLDCSTFVKVLDVPKAAVDRSQGDIHPAGNPHYLIDPRAGAAVARGIAQRLAQLDPSHAAAYQQRLGRLLAELDAARKRVEARLAARRGAPVVTYHRTFSYLADWLGLEVIDCVEPKPGIPPSGSHVAQLFALARARKVKAILQERYYPDATSRTLAERIPASLVSVAGGTDFAGGQSYVAHVEDVALRVAAALEGKAP